MSTTINLIKVGCNIRIFAQDNDTGVSVNYYVDRKNFEIVASQQKNTFAINIKSGKTFETDNFLTTNNFLIGGVVINSITPFNTNIAILMAC